MPLPLLQQSPFKLEINGKSLSTDLENAIMSVTVEKDLNLPGQFTVQLGGLDLQQSILESFAIGQEVKIQMDGKTPQPTLVGEIAGLEPEFRCDRPFNLTVWGFDRLHRLQRIQKTHSFTKLKDSQIAESIATEAGLVAQVRDSEVIHDYLFQANQTNLAFLQERAQLIHYDIFVEDRTLFFQPTDPSATPKLQVSLGQDLLEFYPRLSSISQRTQVQVRGWNMQQKATIVSASNARNASPINGIDVAQALGTAIATISDRPVLSSSEATQIANAQLDRTLLELIVGEGVCWGNPALEIGKTIQIEGLNPLFNGTYYVTGVSHFYSFEVGYTTHFKVRRNRYDVD